MTPHTSPTPPAPAATHTRFNESFLARHERRVLHAIARRLPAAVTPNQLTALGFVGALVVIAGYALSQWNVPGLWLATLGLVIHWFGDSLDGTLARVRQIERPRYGFYLDQVIDAVGNTVIALGVGLAPWARMDIALVVLALYHMLSIQVYVRAIVDHEFHLAVGRLGPTEMRIGIIGMNLGVVLFGAPPAITWPVPMTWCDLTMIALSSGLLGLFTWQMVGHLRRLSKEDPGAT